MIAGNLGVVVVEAKMRFAAIVIASQQKVVRFTKLERFTFLQAVYDSQVNEHTPPHSVNHVQGVDVLVEAVRKPGSVPGSGYP